MENIAFTELAGYVSIAFGIYFGLLASNRTKAKDDKNAAAEMTTVIIKLESISTGIAEIKTEINTIRNDVKSNTERLIKVEESAKQAHKRMDAFQLRRLPDDVD